MTPYDQIYLDGFIKACTASGVDPGLFIQTKQGFSLGRGIPALPLWRRLMNSAYWAKFNTTTRARLMRHAVDNAMKRGLDNVSSVGRNLSQGAQNMTQAANQTLGTIGKTIGSGVHRGLGIAGTGLGIGAGAAGLGLGLGADYDLPFDA